MEMLVMIGGLVMLVGWIWTTVVAFQKSALWGIGTLLLMVIVGTIFAIQNWKIAQKPYLIWLAGFVLYLIGFAATQA